jgi:hypothetical protein
MDAVVVSAANATLAEFCLVMMRRVNLNVSMLVGALGSMRVEGSRGIPTLLTPDLNPWWMIPIKSLSFEITFDCPMKTRWSPTMGDYKFHKGPRVASY